MPWALLAGCIGFDWVVFRGLTVFGHSPDPVLAAALAVAALGHPRTAAVVGFAGGILADLLGGVLVGIGGVSRALAAFAAGRFVAQVGTEPYALLLALAVLASAAEWGISLMGAWAFGVPVALSSYTLAEAASQVLLTAALFSVLYPVGAWWYRPGFQGRVQDPEGR